MKKLFVLFLMISMVSLSCRKYLDINSDPDTPQNPDPTSVLPVILSNIPGGGGERGTGGVQSDGLWIGAYTQMWNSRLFDVVNIALSEWDRQGYNGFTGDRAAGIWRLLYFGAGKNMEYCIDEGIKRGQWDVVGSVLAIKAYLFQTATNYHGDIIFRDAFKEDSLFFRWDDQSVVYSGVDSLCRLAVSYLNRTDYNPSSLRMTRGDLVHGNASNLTQEIDRWKKFAYGILARNFAALSNKSIYSADSVIKYADLAMANGNDDFLIPFEASRNADANWFGTFRNNLVDQRQSDFIVKLLDGTILAGSKSLANRDPRIRHMLVRSADTAGTGNDGYRGIVPLNSDPNGSSTTTAALRARIPVLWGDSLNANPGVSNFAAPAGKYLFHNKAVFPIMTYAEMQFVKAEAALRKGDAATAYTAYRNGITAHFDFINRSSYPRSNAVLYNQTQITTTERNAYLASANVKQSAAVLTLGDIMQQKFIALWGWGFVETWTDMRRYHYYDIDPATNQSVYWGLPKILPAQLSPDNKQQYVYRVRPRYNSEYVWNIYLPPAANASDYHTYECWFSKP